jgi:hypothetical protein
MHARRRVKYARDYIVSPIAMPLLNKNNSGEVPSNETSLARSN